MNKYEITAHITLSNKTKPILEKDIGYVNSSKVEITITTTKDNNLEVKAKLFAPDYSCAKGFIEMELLSICNFLSFYYEISVIDSKISNHVQTINHGSNRMIAVSDIFCAVDSIEAPKEIKENSFKHGIEIIANCNQELIEILSTWRDALRQDSNALRFLMLFRLLEWIKGGNDEKARQWADDWLQQQEPDPSRKRPGFKRGEVSIYTFLRDNIHPKEVATRITEYPFELIDENLSSLQNLVKKAIEEKYPDNINNLKNLLGQISPPLQGPSTGPAA